MSLDSLCALKIFLGSYCCQICQFKYWIETHLPQEQDVLAEFSSLFPLRCCTPHLISIDWRVDTGSWTAEMQRQRLIIQYFRV